MSGRNKQEVLNLVFQLYSKILNKNHIDSTSTNPGQKNSIAWKSTFTEDFEIF